MNIKVLIMDVDGTLTDGKVYIGSQGEIFKAFDIKDGYGIKEILPQISCTPVIITGRTSKAVEIRAEELGITHVYQGIRNKLQLFESLCSELNMLPKEIAYIGDDLNDIEIMKAAGLAACPADAADEVKKIADFICSKSGGSGAVRELCDYIKLKNGTMIV